VGDGEQDMVNMSTAEKVRAKIRFHQGEVERLEEFLKQLEEFESEDSAASPATTEQARQDIVSLVAVTIAYARKRYPTLRDRFRIG
jgi:hypothetical protein